MSPHRKRPAKILLPILHQTPEEFEDWVEGDPAVPHPEASADPGVEKAFLAALDGEARPARYCCEAMEAQLGFARSAPVILFDGKDYWLPLAGTDGAPQAGAKVDFCPWCGRRLAKREERPDDRRPRHPKNRRGHRANKRPR